MSNVPSSTPNDLIAAFDRGFTGMQPIAERKRTLAEQLEPLQERIIARRRSGYGWAQIAEVLAKVGITIAPGGLRRMFGEPAKKTTRSGKRAVLSIRALPPDSPRIPPVAPVPPVVPAKPVKMHLFVDPLTGKETIVPAKH